LLYSIFNFYYYNSVNTIKFPMDSGIDPLKLLLFKYLFIDQINILNYILYILKKILKILIYVII